MKYGSFQFGDKAIHCSCPDQDSRAQRWEKPTLRFLSQRGCGWSKCQVEYRGSLGQHRARPPDSGPTVEPSVRRTRARTVDTLPLQLMHWLRTLLRECPLVHSASVVPRHSILSPMSGVFPLWHSCHLCGFPALGQGRPLAVLIVSWYFCQMAGAQLLSNDRLSGQPAGPEHTTGRWSRPMTLTLGLCWNLSQRLSPDIAGAGCSWSSKGRTRQVPGQMGDGQGDGDALGQRQAAECSLLPCGPNSSLMPPWNLLWLKRERVGSKWCLF